MLLSEAYEDGGQWWANIIEAEPGDVRPEGIQLQTRDDDWTNCGGHGVDSFVSDIKYRVPVKPPASNDKDPYAGLTLPDPPKGYRLAKWGEEVPEKSLWWDCDEKGNDGTWENKWCSTWPWSKWEMSRNHPSLCIFAVPNESTLPKTWQFREDPWVVPEPKTLADVPEMDAHGLPVRVLCTVRESPNLLVRCRSGEWGCDVLWDRSRGPVSSCASEYKVVAVIDPQPSPPLTLEQVPDGRVVADNGFHFWRVGGKWWWLAPEGEIRVASSPSVAFTATNLIAEFK